MSDKITKKVEEEKNAYCPFTSRIDPKDETNYLSAECGDWCKLHRTAKTPEDNDVNRCVLEDIFQVAKMTYDK